MANIDKYLSDIRKDKFCKDMRETFCEALIEANKNAEETEEIVKNIKNEIAATNATAEVIDARKGKKTLGLRLDETEEKISVLDSQLEHKAKQSDLKTLESRMNNFTALPEGSTTGDAELIDGRIGVDGIEYKNIGASIRKQINNLVDGFNNTNKIKINIEKNNNLLNIEDFETTIFGLTITIKDNIIKLNGTSTNDIAIKLTNGVEVREYYETELKQKWSQENTDKLIKVGNSYGLTNFKLNGAPNLTNNTAIVSARDSTHTSVLSPSKGLVSVSNSLSYIQLYVRGTVAFDNCEIGVILSENEFATEYIKYGSKINVDIDNTKDYIRDYPTVLNGEIWLEITGTNFNAIQGGCSDGEYIYCGIVHDAYDAGNTTVHKIDIKTKEIVKTVRNFSLGHCNSMTYCDYDGYIHCVSLDGKSTIHRINTDLEYIDSYEVNILTHYPESTGFGGIDYNKDKEIFTFLIRGNKKGYAIFTKNLTFVKIIWTESVPSYVYGGLYTDKNFIYQTICGSNNKNAEIGIFTWEGTLVKSVNVGGWYGEIEEMFLVGNRMFATACKFDYTNHEIWELIPSNFALI